MPPEPADPLTTALQGLSPLERHAVEMIYGRSPNRERAASPLQVTSREVGAVIMRAYRAIASAVEAQAFPDVALPGGG